MRVRSCKQIKTLCQPPLVLKGRGDEGIVGWRSGLGWWLSFASLATAAGIVLCMLTCRSVLLQHLSVTFASSNSAGPALRTYGHLRVQSLLAREKFPSHFQRAPLIAQFSSLGSLDERWLTNEFRGSLSAGLTSSGGELALDPPLLSLPQS